VAAGVVVYATIDADRLEKLVAVVGLGGVLLLLLALVIRQPLVAAAGIAGVGASYAVAAWSRGRDVPLEAPIVAAALLACAELAFWSLERLVAEEERGVALRRLALILGVAVAAMFVGSMLLVPAAAPSGLGLGGDVLGVAAAVAVVSVLLAASRRA
jgi:hypothetical protein